MEAQYEDRLMEVSVRLKREEVALEGLKQRELELERVKRGLEE